MPIHSSTTSVKEYGGEVWTTEGNASNSVYIPYGGGNYTPIFSNTGGYHALIGRIYVCLAISQAHQGIYDFNLSNYGGGFANRSTGAHNSFISFSQVTYGGLPSCRLTNTNGSSWGNGSYKITIDCWSGEGAFLGRSNGDDDNFSSPNSGAFFVRAS